MNTRSTAYAALSALVLAFAAGPAGAQVVNGTFDGLAGWTTGGDAAAAGNQLVLTTASATWQDDFDAGLAAGARNVSGNEPLPVASGAGSLEAFAGVPPGAFDVPATGAYAYEGSAASQTFTAAAGSQLSFRWDLSTLDQRDPAQADYAFIVIDGQASRLADAFAATTPIAGGDYAAHTGWTDYTATFANGGTHTVAFGVVDVGDFNDTSALAVAAVTVSAVPETTPLALMAAGLGLLALQRRRRRG